MSNIKFNLRDLNPISFEIDCNAFADVLLDSNSEAQAEFLNRFFSLLSFDRVLDLSKKIGKNDRALHGVRNLCEYTNKEHAKILQEREQYEQSEQAKRDREMNDYMFEHSPDGRPWR